ncbi:MAG: hypothetical protein ACF8XB_13935, partial [Planctomycetota bacterium JB042]
MLRRPLIPRLAAAAALLAAPAIATAAEDDSNATPTAAIWYHGRTSSQVVSLTNQGYRIVDHEVEAASPLRFT